VFQLSGNVGDSILIHVNYKTKDFRVKKISDNYRLLEKNYLGEVVVSNYAARLFELTENL
jgi:hypothetical protein